MQPWCMCVFDQFDEGMEAIKAVCDCLNARMRGLEVVLSGLTTPLFLRILSDKLGKCRVWRLSAKCGLWKVGLEARAKRRQPAMQRRDVGIDELIGGSEETRTSCTNPD